MIPKRGKRKTPKLEPKFKEKENNNNAFTSQCSQSYYELVLLQIGLCTQYRLYFTILHDFIHNLWKC